MKGKLLLVLCLLLLLSCLSLVGFSQIEPKASNILPVHDLNTGLNYGTIQDAINANETLNGDTIRVDAGTYYEHITISHAIHLVGESPESTIIDGNNTGSVIDLGVHSNPPYTNNVSISNFTIRNAGPVQAGGFSYLNACVRGVYVQNIDLENNVFLNAGRCIVLANSSVINISNNDISNSAGQTVDVGAGSTNVTIRDNLIHDYGTVGIQDDGNSINCNFINNTIEKGQYGILLVPNWGTELCPANITVSDNLVNDCSICGIVITGDTRDCNITDNTVQNCPYGIALQTDETLTSLAPVGNLIDGNILSNDNCTNISYVGAVAIGQNQDSYTNIFRGNNMTNFGYHNLMVWGYNLASFMQDIDSSNMANGKRIYYLTNQSNLELNPSSLPDTGSLALVNCANVTVKDFDFTGNNDGLLLAGSTDCTLTNLTLANNRLYLFNQSNPSIYGGLTLFNSTGNTVVDCRICNNTCGVLLSWSSDGNTFCHNAFVGNDEQVISDSDSPFGIVTTSGTSSTCIWNNTVEGNYWSDYNGTDLNQDGIGDTSYTIDSNNVDHYPLMGTFNSFNITSQCSVETVSNSTISNFQFNGTAISFNASGENGTTGFCRVSIPTALINGTLTVFINETEVPYTLLAESNSTQSHLYFTYHHSTQQIIITRALTVYIRANGSIDPPTAPISTVDNVTYTFTGNINYPTYNGIVVERNNIEIDGKGYTVQGFNQSGTGLNLTNISNVTIENTNIENFQNGTYLLGSNNSIISGNNITANGYCGIYLDSSSYDTVSGNNVTANSIGIKFRSTSNNTVSGNNVATNSIYGIFLVDSSNNTVSGNNVTANNYGIVPVYSSYDVVSGNNVTANNYGIVPVNSSNDLVSGNNVTANNYGIVLDDSTNDTASGNNITTNRLIGIGLQQTSNSIVRGNMFFNDGLVVYDVTGSFGNAVVDNLVNGKPLVYLEKVSDYIVSDAGQVVLVDCNRIIVENLNLSYTDIGVELLDTSNSSISGNVIANNVIGINLNSSSNNNSVSGNNITANSYQGIFLDSSTNNTVSGNNITANSDCGILLMDDSSFNILSGNDVISSGNYGILIASANNWIYHNNFVNNTHQAGNNQLGLTNIWDNGTSGNYWSDYQTKYPNAIENDSSGIWNTPYVIDTNNIDHYPLVVSNVVPEFPSLQATMFFMLLTLLAVIIYKKKASEHSITLKS